MPSPVSPIMCYQFQAKWGFSNENIKWYQAGVMEKGARCARAACAYFSQLCFLCTFWHFWSILAFFTHILCANISGWKFGGCYFVICFHLCQAAEAYWSDRQYGIFFFQGFFGAVTKLSTKRLWSTKKSQHHQSSHIFLILYLIWADMSEEKEFYKCFGGGIPKKKSLAKNDVCW